jgi:hypothetical protein
MFSVPNPVLNVTDRERTLLFDIRIFAMRFDTIAVFNAVLDQQRMVLWANSQFHQRTREVLMPDKDKTEPQSADHLLENVRRAEARFLAAVEGQRDTAREQFINALQVFKDFVMHGKLPR